MRDGCYFIGGRDRRVADHGPPSRYPERRIADRYIELPDPTVSHPHAKLIVYRGSVRLIDLGSTRGTHVLRPDGRYRIYEQEVDPRTAVEFGLCRRTVSDLLESAVRDPGETKA